MKESGKVPPSAFEKDYPRCDMFPCECHRYFGQNDPTKESLAETTARLSALYEKEYD